MNEPLNPIGGNRGFFSSLFSNKYSDAMNAYIEQQQRAGKSSRDVQWNKVTQDELKAAYRNKYHKPFPG